MQVDDLVDVNMVRQGSPGYSNSIVEVGDVFVSVDGRDVQGSSLDELHHMLRGMAIFCSYRVGLVFFFLRLLTYDE